MLLFFLAPSLWSDSAHWIRTNVTGRLLRMQSLRMHVSSSFEIRWVHLPPTSQALWCDYCPHIHRDDDAQTIHCAALIGGHRGTSAHGALGVPAADHVITWNFSLWHSTCCVLALVISWTQLLNLCVVHNSCYKTATRRFNLIYICLNWP